MKLFHSLLFRLVVIVALVESAVMFSFEYIHPLTAIAGEYPFLGSVLDVLALTLVITLIYLRILKKPLDAFIDVTVARGKGDLSRRANTKEGGELGTLAIAFNEMADKLQSHSVNLEREVLERTERLRRTQQGTLNILEDLHESKVALEKSRESFINIVVKSVDGILVVCRDGLIRFASPSAAQMLGTEIENMVGTDFGLQVHEGQVREIRIVRADGEVGVGEIRSTPTQWAGLDSYLITIRDITERKRMEEADKANIRFLEGLERLDQAIKLDADVEKMLWNAIKAVFLFFECDRAWLFHPCDPNAPSFRVPVEISRPEYPGANVLGIDVPMTPELAQNLREALASDEPVIYTAGTERPINKLSAEKFGVQSQMFVALYPKLGKPWAFGIHQCSHPRIWTVEEKRLFKEFGRRISDGLSDALFLHELQDSNEKLKKLDQLKTEFISTVSHELRTPLAIIKEGVGLVLDEIPGKINQDQSKLLNMSKDNVDRLANIINDLLDMSKIEAGKVEIKRRRVNMSSLLKDVCDAWNVAVAKKNQFCECVVPAPEVDINVDGEKITQVLNNLISNALKFAQDGRVVVKLEDKKDAVDVSVSNIGVGISAENLPQVFGKFQQFNRPSGSGPHGTGLGLVISKSLVELHGGTITVESEPGKVTCFTFTLPKMSEV